MKASDGSGEVISGACRQNNPPGRRDTDRGCTTHSHGGNRFSNLLPTVQLHEDHSTGKLSLVQQLQVITAPAATGGKRQCTWAAVSCIEDGGISGL